MSEVNLNGNIYTDTGSATGRDLRGVDGYGHRRWLLQMLSDAVADFAGKQSAALASQNAAAGSATSAASSVTAAQAAGAAAGAAAGLPALAGNARKVLKVNDAETGVLFDDGLLGGYQEYLFSGSWDKPSGATWVYVEAIAGGASGYGGTNAIGQGGGGGAFVSGWFRASDLPASVAVVVGAGGPSKQGGALASNNGGSSSFGSYLTAPGGKGDGTSGGGLRAPSGEYQLSGYDSGPGARASSSNYPGGNAVKGGAGGGNGYSSPGQGGVSLQGGNGGAGGASGPGGAGVVPGGAGGGSFNGVGGPGAAGRVRVWWF